MKSERLLLLTLMIALILTFTSCSSEKNDASTAINNTQNELDLKDNNSDNQNIYSQEDKIQEDKTQENDTTAPEAEPTYIIENSDTTKITLDTIVQLKEDVLPYARNEIFARHGYVFNNAQYEEYFSNQSWYIPVADNSIIKLDDIETYNVEKLKYYENFFKDSSQELAISNAMDIVDNNQTTLIDLNGDGTNEEVNFQGSEFEYTLTVNGISIEGQGEELLDSFAIVDIDSKDKYKEIVVSEYGPSCDYYSYYYYFDGSNLINIGSTEGMFEQGIGIDGTGKLYASTRSGILQTWFYNKQFSLDNNHKIKENPNEIYRTESPVTIKNTLKLPTSREANSEFVTFNIGEPIDIIATDDMEWCLVEGQDGTKVWLGLEEDGTIKDTGKYPESFLYGLCFAD